MAERQKHGFMFEQYCAERYNLTLNQDYTAKFDAVTEDGIPVSSHGPLYSYIMHLLRCGEYRYGQRRWRNGPWESPFPYDTSIISGHRGHFNKKKINIHAYRLNSAE
jgi:hypothetical protein